MRSETVEQDGIKIPLFQFIAADLDAMDAKPLFRTLQKIDQRVIACFEGEIDEAELLVWGKF